ncbi:branched-chain amino acid ABC transporter permease [Roseospira marina]|uniref:Branched-chain amino acid ABC transporter permease n=2 Tax=Roseospira marina TaxID=140057 RepID=A0A5M6IGJ3_9PROT|nr:branched-chain amino acid ABC transporter permease [Roseospira marina]KAA5606795.1 branched-chain amino acid ABC transporter permease [Roseospira marina]
MQMLFSERVGGMGALILVIACLPLLLSNNYQYDVAITMGINAIVVVGLNLLVGYAGQVSLGHAGFFALGAYASAILTTRYGLHGALALPAGALGVGVLAYLIARPILRLSGHYLAMATLGVGVIIHIVLDREAWLTGGPDGMYVPTIEVAGVPLYGGAIWYWIVAAVLILTVWLALNLIDSPIGRALRGLHGAEVAAEVAGVDTTHYKVMVFVISAVLASVAGSLSAHFSEFVTPDSASFFHSILFVTMVVFGGMASTFGALIGAALLTLLPQLLADFSGYEQMILGLIMMLVMIVMPRGLLPTLVGLARRRQREARS